MRDRRKQVREGARGKARDIEDERDYTIERVCE